MGAAFLSLFAFFSMAWAHSSLNDEWAEHLYRPSYLSQARGTPNSRRTDALYPWPVTVRSIGNSIASYQLYSSDLSEAYFHHGLDIRADAGSDVHAVVGGKVLGVTHYQAGELYWEIAIQDADGFIWQYHHVDHDSIPQEIFSAQESGTMLHTGDKLGQVVSWPVVSEGEEYDHIHLNVIGAGQAYLNGLAFLKPLPVQTNPEIIDTALLQEGNRVAGTEISGNYSILIEARDLFLSEKFYLPPNRIAYQIDGGPEELTWQFDSLPGGSSDSQYVNQFYVPSLTCGDYDCRKPVIDLGFRKGQRAIFPKSVGAHRIHVTVTDYYGHAASKDFSWTVSN